MILRRSRAAGSTAGGPGASPDAVAADGLDDADGLAPEADVRDGAASARGGKGRPGKNGKSGKSGWGGRKAGASQSDDEEFDRAFNSGFGHRLSLRWRLTLLTALIVAASVGLMTLAAFVTVQATLYREVDDNLKTQATQLLNSPYASEFAIEPIVTADSLKILNPNLDAMFFARDNVTGRGGTINIGGPELAVIRGNRMESLRTDEFSNKRIYAIHDPSGATLVLAHSLEIGRAHV